MESNQPWKLRGEEAVRYKKEINKENRVAIRLFSTVGVPLSIVITLTQWVLAERNLAFWCSLPLIAYFIVCALAERFWLPREYPHATGLLYVLECPPLLLAVLLGTVLDPSRQAITILLFLIAMPAFIMDRTRRLLLFSGGWTLLFLVLSFAVKDKEIRTSDLMHALEFFFVSATLINVLLHSRNESVRNLMQGEYHLEHERQTGCLNRYALAKRAKSYVGQSVTVILADLDSFTLYNDFYGHEAGQKILRTFTDTLMRVFGAESTYHYNGDEFLCVVKGDAAEEYEKRIAACRRELDGFILDGSKLPLTVTCGCVTGTPATMQEFHGMIQLANIYAHKAQRTGPGGFLSDAYTADTFRRGVAESNISTHAPASEISQLTGLPGMSYFVTRSDALLSHLINLPRKPLVGFFRLIQLRNFNGAFGYAQGDALIAETARLLQQNLKDRYICHITGAKFGILCYENEVEGAMQRISEALRQYKPGFPVRCIAGFARYTGNESVISLLDKARVAQSMAPEDGDTLYCFYDDEIDRELQFRQYIISHVDEAIEKGWLQVYYQPIARAVTGQVCNEEALSRWNDPQYGFLMPGRFIPILEENALIYKVNLHVVRQALRDFARRESMGVPIVPVSVNLSRRDFEKCDMVQEITQMVDASGYPHSMIKIEITESAFVENLELLKRQVERFRSNGFDVWMDDFGSEYSTLNLLQELDFDLIKIDMRFMKDFSLTGKNGVIVSDIIDMAKRMGITTLTEGVESAEHYRMLRTLGCEKIQGYLFNTPNSFGYIAERAQNKTGLVFETPGAAPYYEAVGRIDLNEPLSFGQKGAEAHIKKELPAGVVEACRGKLKCLRATAPFLRMLDGWGLLLPEENGRYARTFKDQLPDQLRAGIASCLTSPGWTNIQIDTPQEGLLTVYMCRVSTAADRDASAILIVLLHSQIKTA